MPAPWLLPKRLEPQAVVPMSAFAELSSLPLHCPLPALPPSQSSPGARFKISAKPRRLPTRPKLLQQLNKLPCLSGAVSHLLWKLRLTPVHKVLSVCYSNDVQRFSSVACCNLARPLAPSTGGPTIHRSTRIFSLIQSGRVRLSVLAAFVVRPNSKPSHDHTTRA